MFILHMANRRRALFNFQNLILLRNFNIHFSRHHRLRRRIIFYLPVIIITNKKCLIYVCEIHQSRSGGRLQAPATFDFGTAPTSEKYFATFEK
jgi:hypothetical protein